MTKAWLLMWALAEYGECEVRRSKKVRSARRAKVAPRNRQHSVLKDVNSVAVDTHCGDIHSISAGCTVNDLGIRARQREVGYRLEM